MFVEVGERRGERDATVDRVFLMVIRSTREVTVNPAVGNDKIKNKDGMSISRYHL